MNKLLFAPALIALASPALAVQHGQDVTAEEYQDFTVRFEAHDGIGTASCGGTLIAGKYILSAAHCVGDRLGSDEVVENKQYDWWIDNGASNSITVYQGVEFRTENKTTTTYKVIDFVNFNETMNLSYQESLAIIAKYPSYDWSIYSQQMTPEIILGYSGIRHYDIALIELAEPLSQRSHAAILGAYNPSTNGFNYQAGQHFEFKGWGQDENYQTPTVMQKTTMFIPKQNVDYLDNWLSANSYTPNFPMNSEWDENKQVFDCGDPRATKCWYDLRDLMTLYPLQIDHTLGSGDSGTPLTMNNNQVIAIAKSTHIHPQSQFSSFTHLGWYLPSLSRAIDKVTAPSLIDLNIKEGDELPSVQQIAVQNLTTETQTLLPSSDSEAFTVSGCEATLAPLEFCELSIQTHAKGEGVISLNDNRNTTINIGLTIEQDSGGEEGDGNEGGDDNGSSGGSSGGSTTLYTLLALFGLLARRKL